MDKSSACRKREGFTALEGLCPNCYDDVAHGRLIDLPEKGVDAGREAVDRWTPAFFLFWAIAVPPILVVSLMASWLVTILLEPLIGDLASALGKGVLAGGCIALVACAREYRKWSLLKATQEHT